MRTRFWRQATDRGIKRISTALATRGTGAPIIIAQPSDKAHEENATPKEELPPTTCATAALSNGELLEEEYSD